MLLPLKKKYLEQKSAGMGHAGSQNSAPKKKSIWALLEKSAKTGKHKRGK